MIEEEKRSLELAMASLDREFGKGSVIRLGNENVEPWPAIPTGALTLDVALGIGGLPRGRIVEIFGNEGVGKTTLAMCVVAQAQAMGLICLYVDAEHAIDPTYTLALGVSLDDLLLAQPDSGEAAMEIVDRLVKTGEVGCIVIDSVAALVPKAELDGEMSDQQMGAQARLMSKVMRKIVGEASDTKTLIIFINQLREKIGVVYGNPSVTPGGRALKFSASVRIDLRRVEDIKQGKDGSKIGIRVKAIVIKNRLSRPYLEAEYDILYGRGINSVGCILDTAVLKGIVVKSGSWFSYGDNKNFAQGRDAAMTALASDVAMLNEIKGKIVG